MNTPTLSQFRRIVVKVGSSLLVDRARGRLRHAWLAALAEDLAELHQRGADILVVSSGAIALGRTVLGLPSGNWIAGLILGAIGAVIGTLGGAEARAQLAKAFGRDLPAALIEDVVAVVVAFLAVHGAA